MPDKNTVRGEEVIRGDSQGWSRDTEVGKKIGTPELRCRNVNLLDNIQVNQEPESGPYELQTKAPRESTSLKFHNLPK